jgi:hypothetical protein
MGGCRKLHKEEFHELYSSPSIIRTIKLRMRWGMWREGGGIRMCIGCC